MFTFKDFYLQESFKAAKTASRYDTAAGDRERVTAQFLSDKKKLTANEKKTMRKFFRVWKASKGTIPVFEAKATAEIGGVGKTMLYGVEIQKRQPPFHVMAARKPINNGKSYLYIWLRIFTDYNKYGDYISSFK